MKYIRTKDEIIDLSTITIGKDGWESIEEYIAFKQEDQKEQIKQADTIEELCDEFIGILNGRHIKSLSKDLYILKPCETIYGAIWTDKGLIYVAKMNDKGELELL